MTVQQITDPASIARQGVLLAALENLAADWKQKSGHLLDAGYTKQANRGHERSAWLQACADRVRDRLVTASHLDDTITAPGLADVLAQLPDGKLAQIAPTVAAELVPVESFKAGDLIGRQSSTGAAIQEVAAWLRTHLADLWRSASEGYLQRVALWLLMLREAVEAGRWKR